MVLGPFRRFVAILCTAWLTLLLAEVPGLHACAVHSAPSSAGAHAGIQHDHNHGSNSTHKGQCSCLGNACCALAIIPASRPPLVGLAVQVSARKLVSPGASESLPGTPEYTIPFPNGPPASPSAPLNTAA